MKRDCDFAFVHARHDTINRRLEHWAIWVRVRPQAWKAQPMFRQYRSHAWQWHVPEIKIDINTLEAHEIEKAVSFLPDKHRTALRWCYVFCQIPAGLMQRNLAVSQEGLAKLVTDGRDMLKNRLQEKLVNQD